MQKQTLREISKYGAGLITGDFLVGLWFVTSGRVPFNFLGVTWTFQATLFWMIFDAVLLAFLVFFGWHITDRKRTSTERSFLYIAGTVFLIVALLHLSRIVFGLNLVIGSWAVPYWLNAVGAVVTLFLCYASFHFANAEGKKK